MVNIAAPWGGAIKALRLMASGDNIDVKIFLRLSFLFDLLNQNLGLCCLTNSCSSLPTFSSINSICHAKSQFLG